MAKKEKTSQFGIRRLRRSVYTATARTATVGHQAIECIILAISTSAYQFHSAECNFPTKPGRSLCQDLSPHRPCFQLRMYSHVYATCRSVEWRVYTFPFAGPAPWLAYAMFCRVSSRFAATRRIADSTRTGLFQLWAQFAPSKSRGTHFGNPLGASPHSATRPQLYLLRRHPDKHAGAWIASTSSLFPEFLRRISHFSPALSQHFSRSMTRNPARNSPPDGRRIPRRTKVAAR